MAIFQMFEMEIYLQHPETNQTPEGFSRKKKDSQIYARRYSHIFVANGFEGKNAKMNVKNALVCPRDFHCDFLVVGRKSRPPIRKPSHRDLLLSSLRKCALSDVV